MPVRRSHFAAVALLTCGACTDASLYSMIGDDPGRADRAALEGVVCAPTPSGRHFPAVVVFALQGGVGVEPNTRAALTEALGATADGYTSPSIAYGLVAFNAFAFNLVPEGLTDAVGLSGGLTRYTSFGQSGPVSLSSPLQLAESLLSGRMISQCPAARARTRYSVVLIAFEPDEAASCAGGPDDPCDGSPRCGECRAVQQVERIRALAERYGTGEVTVQPLYVPLEQTDPLAREQAAAIAAAGGTAEKVVDVENLRATLQGLNFAGSERRLELRTFFAFNRNLRARAGELLADSDGDGIGDSEERSIGTDLATADTDGDGLLDGVEVITGQDPLASTEVRGCDAFHDGDRDGLTECEERLLGSDDCMGDSDGDAVPDLLEAFARSNPLSHEQARDSDRDGFSDLDELRRQTDPLSADLEYLGTRSQYYEQEELEVPAAGTPEAEIDPCPGRRRWRLRVRNTSLAATEATGQAVAGANSLSFFAVFGTEGLDRGTIARTQTIEAIRTNSRDRVGAIELLEESFETRP